MLYVNLRNQDGLSVRWEPAVVFNHLTAEGCGTFERAVSDIDTLFVRSLEKWSVNLELQSEMANYFGSPSRPPPVNKVKSEGDSPFSRGLCYFFICGKLGSEKLVAKESALELLS